MVICLGGGEGFFEVNCNLPKRQDPSTHFFSRLNSHTILPRASEFCNITHHGEISTPSRGSGGLIMHCLKFPSLSLPFQRQFSSGGHGLADTRMFQFQILLELRIMEAVLITGAVRRAERHTNSQTFHRRDALPVAQPIMSKHRPSS